MGTIANNDNLYGVSKWIVNPTAGKGTHTTIQAAITSASAGDSIFIFPATYTENITLKNGVNLCGLNTFGGSGEATLIIGKLIDNGVTISCTLTNLAFHTNSDYISVQTGSGTIVFDNCRLVCVNNTGLNIGAGSTYQLYNCTADVSTTGIGLYTGSGAFQCYYTNISNSGNTVTASTTAGTTNYYNSLLSIPISCSSSGGIVFRNGTIDTSVQNTTCITTAGSQITLIGNSNFLSGSASAISIGTGTTLKMFKCSIDSTNTNPVTGAGTYLSDETTYSNTGILPNTTTRTFAIVGENAAWTPVLTFGGGSTNLTYAARSGSYTRIGNVVTFTCDVELSAKGISTGNAQIAGLPYNPAATTICVISASLLTFVGQVNARMAGGNSALILDVWATTGARSQLSDTAFGNSTFVQISGSYLV